MSTGALQTATNSGTIYVMPPRSAHQQPALLRSVAGSRDGVVSRGEALTAGYGHDAIRRRVANGDWQAIGAALVLHGGPVTDLQRAWAATFTAGFPSALAGRSAALHYGLRRFEPDAVEIAIPRGRRPVAIEGVRWRAVSALRDTDVLEGTWPPIVPRGLAIAQAAAWTDRPRTACGLVLAAVQQRVVSIAMVQRVIADYPKLRHRGIVLAVLNDAAGGADSLSEIDFTKIARRAGIPPPQRQSVRLDASGRKRYIDADFEYFSVEVDGGIHMQVMNFWDDARRQNDLVIGGDRILRFPSIALRLEPDVVAAQLRAACARFGRSGGRRRHVA